MKINPHTVETLIPASLVTFCRYFPEHCMLDQDNDHLNTSYGEDFYCPDDLLMLHQDGLQINFIEDPKHGSMAYQRALAGRKPGTKIKAGIHCRTYLQ